MPELPEVENLARGLRREVLGARIEEVCCHWNALLASGPERFSRAVRGRRIRGILRHGKYLFLELDGPARLALHLRMTGQLLLVPRAQPADKHTHLEMLLAGRAAKIIYRDVRKFGRLLLLERGIEEFIREKDLGSDALQISAPELERSLARTTRSIKAVLLDQTVLAGLGNIYVDEILFREGISPLRPACRLKPGEIASLVATTRRVLQAAIRRSGTSISDYVDVRGRRGGYQNALLVYDRQGQPCRRCGRPLLKERVAGRGTHYCPRCQSR